MPIVEILKAILFGVVEGITEWLPISSTGHMILLNEFVKLNVSEEFWNLFLVVIQLGAILAVVILYWKTIWPFKRVKTKQGGSKIKFRKQTFILWLKALVACIPAGVVGVLADDWLDEHLYTPQIVAIMLIVVGVAFIIIEIFNANRVPRVEKLRDLTFKDAFVIGLFQLIAAVLPGTSRSGATILGGLMIGISRTVAAKFTFILAIPVMAGASLLKIVKYGFVCGLHRDHRLPHELHQEARFQGVRRLPHYPGHSGPGLFLPPSDARGRLIRANSELNNNLIR